MEDDCLLCRQLLAGELLVRRPLAAAVRDPYPLTPGHTLLVPHRHVSDFFALSEQEWRELGELLREVKARLEQDFKPDGFNVGVDVGAAAGQRLLHAHVHVIPRFQGDGGGTTQTGMRWLVPTRASLAQAGTDEARLGLEQPERD